MVLFDCAIIRLDRELQLRKINCSAWYTETFFYILISSAILERESSNCLNAPTGIAPRPNHKVSIFRVTYCNFNSIYYPWAL